MVAHRIVAPKAGVRFPSAHPPESQISSKMKSVITYIISVMIHNRAMRHGWRKTPPDPYLSKGESLLTANLPPGRSFSCL